MTKKQKSAKSFAESSYNTGGLFGNSTTNKEGTTYNPTGQISRLGKSSMSNWQSALNDINNFNNTDYSKDKNYKVYADNLRNQMTSNYNNVVLNNLANNGLMRSSGLQAANNAFNDTLANQTANLYDSYGNNRLNYLNGRLSANQNTANNLYNYLSGVNSGSQNNASTLNSFNLGKLSADNSATANNNAMYATLASSIAGLATSDIRVKKHIKRIGKENGFNIYEFEYKSGLGLPKGKFIGVIAQEVEKVRPDAVVTVNGVKMVNYNKIGLEMRVA